MREAEPSGFIFVMVMLFLAVFLWKSLEFCIAYGLCTQRKLIPYSISRIRCMTMAGGLYLTLSEKPTLHYFAFFGRLVYTLHVCSPLCMSK